MDRIDCIEEAEDLTDLVHLPTARHELTFHEPTCGVLLDRPCTCDPLVVHGPSGKA